ncbi:MAG: hypothetical protein ACOC4B_02380 [Bacteroidota bacterium]
MEKEGLIIIIRPRHMIYHMFLCGVFIMRFLIIIVALSAMMLCDMPVYSAQDEAPEGTTWIGPNGATFGRGKLVSACFDEPTYSWTFECDNEMFVFCWDIQDGGRILVWSIVSGKTIAHTDVVRAQEYSSEIRKDPNEELEEEFFK